MGPWLWSIDRFIGSMIVDFELLQQQIIGLYVSFVFVSCRYDFVEVEEPSDGTILGRWCGSGTVPGKQISKGNQIRIRFVSDEYFPSEPGFCIHYNIVVPVSIIQRFPYLIELLFCGLILKRIKKNQKQRPFLHLIFSYP